MSPAWQPDGQPPATAGGALTVVAGSSFCVSAADGTLDPGAATGYFVQDTRILSRWRVDLVSDQLEPVTAQVVRPHEILLLSRRQPHPTEPATSVLISEERVLSAGLTATFRIRNLAPTPSRVVLRLRVGADFSDVFDVKEGVATAGAHTIDLETTASGMRFTCRDHAADSHPATSIVATGEPIVLPGQFLWDVELPPAAERRVTVTVEPDPLPDVSHSGEPEPDHAWRATRLLVDSAEASLVDSVDRTMADIASLRLFDPRHPDRPVIAAGAPWFMALFGRDALLASWMVLPYDQALAVGSLAALAEAQGTRNDPQTEEQPGRILHELRFGRRVSLTLGGKHRYFGTADATPLFVMLLAELARWGASPDAVAEFLPAADRALDWILEYGDADGDGFVEYEQVAPHGLRNQGWKDSGDAICFADGELAASPIALCEVQAYCYGAFRARAYLARQFGDGAADDWDKRADALQQSFEEAFWLPERGWYAMALDRDKRPVDALASNMGHALWTGIVSEEHASQVAKLLSGPRMATGWGLRTLGEGSARFNPMSYHNGSVWPHDTAIAAAGLMRYGFVDEATSLMTGLLDAAADFDGRLPELFCGFDRQEFGFPVPYPTACSPQAWASAVPLLVLRTMLRLDPDVPNGRLTVDPAVPAHILPVAVTNLMLGDHRLTIEVERGDCRVSGLPEGVEVVRP